MRTIVFTILMSLCANLAMAQQTGSVHVKNATVITVTGEVLENTDVLVLNGKITAIGQNLSTPSSISSVDASGKFVLPGIVDAHSHLGIARGINEATNPVTAEVSMRDVIDPNDVGIYRALAGGVTAMHVLHGSANVIGGQGATVKMTYGGDADEMLVADAPRTIKFALGENPTRVHGQGYGIQPRTRMGVEQVIREHFDEAIEYRRKRNAYLEAQQQHQKNPRRYTAPQPVAKNLRMEVLADIVDGEIRVHCHSYRADEILMLMRVFNDYGIKNYTFQHANEAFKVAPEIAKNGAYTSIFADWWAYKFEVYYSTSYNAAILNHNGVINSINSDSDELIRHLNHEAAKAVRYGGVNEADALKMITINPAIQLGMENRIGSIEVGKEADFAIWSGHPLSIYSMAEKTYVNGVLRFDRDNDPDDMRINQSATQDYDMFVDISGREVDACMQDVFEFFTGTDAQQNHSHR